MSAARKLLLATCIVGALIAVAAIVLSGSLSSDSTNVSNTDADRDTSNPQYPENLVVNENDAGGTVVTAKALGFAPGAIVCADYQAVGVVFHLYSNAWAERAQDSLTRGQSKLLRGDAAPEPDPQSYGCALIPPGTTMRFHSGNVVPVVTVRMPDGKTIKGVTLPEMMASQAETEAAAAAESFRTTILSTRSEFQRQFSTLPRPGPNLRWFQYSDFSILVMPFGPCAVLQQSSPGYIFRELDQPSALRPFPTRDEAEQQAKVVCDSFYRAMEQDPNARMWPNSPSERVVWFSPESVDSSPAPSSETMTPASGEGQRPADPNSANSGAAEPAGHP